MHAIGVLLLLAALASALYGVGEWRRGRRVIRTPFRRTGDLARLAELGTEVSCEGMIQRCLPALAPCSGQPCLYYEVEVLAGKKRLRFERSGEVFHLDDGTGPIEIDPRDGMEVELTVSHDEVGSNGVRVIERLVPMAGHLYVAGRLDRDRILRGPLLASRHGRRVLAGEMKRNVLTGIVGAFLLFPALALLVSVPPREVPPVHEPGRIHDDFGAETMLTITEPGSFIITSGSPRAWIAVEDADAHSLVRNAPGGAMVDLAPGTYTIRVTDSTPGHARTVPGGFPYQLSVTRSVASELWRRPADPAVAMR